MLANFNGSQVCIGKAPAREDDRTLKMANYLPAELPPPLVTPPRRRWSEKVGTSVPMFMNDRVGCCTMAALAHAEVGWTSNNGARWQPSDRDVVEAYQAISGYDPAIPETDVGANMLDALNHARKYGIGGRKIGAYVALDHTRWAEFKAAINLFGGVYLGLRLPQSAQRQDTWRVSLGGTWGDPTPGSWGGHAVWAPDYDDDDIQRNNDEEDGLWVATWGGLQKLTKRWLFAYCDEAYGVLSRSWADADGAPVGFDYDALYADLGRIAS